MAQVRDLRITVQSETFFLFCSRPNLFIIYSYCFDYCFMIIINGYHQTFFLLSLVLSSFLCCVCASQNLSAAAHEICWWVVCSNMFDRRREKQQSISEANNSSEKKNSGERTEINVFLMEEMWWSRQMMQKNRTHKINWLMIEKTEREDEKKNFTSQQLPGDDRYTQPFAVKISLTLLKCNYVLSRWRVSYHLRPPLLPLLQSFSTFDRALIFVHPI